MRACATCESGFRHAYSDIYVFVHKIFVKTVTRKSIHTMCTRLYVGAHVCGSSSTACSICSMYANTSKHTHVNITHT
jgi:hypothetical protein